MWDKWCHYERRNTKLENIIVSDKVIFKILDKKVDTTSCKQDFNFDNIEYNLNLITIYYIGDNLEFINGN